jgi:hypothetical protein
MFPLRYRYSMYEVYRMSAVAVTVYHEVPVKFVHTRSRLSTTSWSWLLMIAIGSLGYFG